MRDASGEKRGGTVGPTPKRAGFTLIELLAVMTIIGILIALILVAANDGVRRAEERATQGLIAKLEAALNDRVDALLNAQAPINQTHRFLAAINYNNGTTYVPVGSTNATGNAALGADVDFRRAQVIAQFDYIRAEIPDVFFLNAATSDGPANSYPLNFAASAYPPGNATLPDAFILPLGNNAPGLPLAPVFNANGQITGQALSTPTIPTTPYGMFGASFSAAGGLYKNLGYAPQGYDGADNDNNGLIDDLGEAGPNAAAGIARLVANHKHNTARSEVLYAILVEGLGPLGSSFAASDFDPKQIQDTDNDGLPEFVDAWGQPLQFYRWPLYHGGILPDGEIFGTSDSQLGYAGYAPGSYRQQDPLDGNQMLVAPSWWSSSSNSGLSTMSTTLFSPPNGANNAGVSQGALGFMANFHSLVDPSGTWDRSGFFARRAYFTKFLIVSGGPDKVPGTAQLGFDYSSYIDAPDGNPTSLAFPSGAVQPTSAPTMQQCTNYLLFIENQAAVANPASRTGSFYEVADIVLPPNPPPAPGVTGYLKYNAVTDDITNHNISGPSTGVR